PTTFISASNFTSVLNTPQMMKNSGFAAALPGSSVLMTVNPVMAARNGCSDATAAQGSKLPAAPSPATPPRRVLRPMATERLRRETGVSPVEKDAPSLQGSGREVHA